MASYIVVSLVRSIGPQGPQTEALTRNDDTGALRLLDVSTRPHQTPEGLKSSVASILHEFTENITIAQTIKRKLTQ